MHKCASPDAPQTEAEGDGGDSLGHGGRRGSSHLLAGTPRERALLGTARWKDLQREGRAELMGLTETGRGDASASFPAHRALPTQPHCKESPRPEGLGSTLSHRARGPPLAQGGRLGQKPSSSIKGQMTTLCSMGKTEGRPRDNPSPRPPKSLELGSICQFSAWQRREWRAKRNVPHPPGIR